MNPKETLQSIIDEFDTEKFERFFRAKNDKLRYPNEPIYLDEKESNFTEGLKLAEGKLDDGEFIVCSFKVGQNLTERSGKKAQYILGKKILKEQQVDAGIFIFYDQQGNFRFSLIYTNYLGKRRDWSNFKRFTYFVSKELTNKTFLNQIGDGDFSTIEKIKDAFSVEKVTEQFFKEFTELFNKIKKHLLKQGLCDVKTTHNFTQQLLNRILFVYFVQKKEWLGNNKHFLRHFWKTYKDNSKNKDEFYDKWLKVLFLETFNNKFVPVKYLPEEINSVLMLAPYLNGGLFEINKLDNIPFTIEDGWFEQIFEFFEKYNFTVDENSENDVDLEIDPKFIGDIYESLVNCSETEDEQSEKGIFYTARVEIDFMSRRSLVEYFHNNLPKNIITKELIYKFVFSKSDEEIAEVENELNKLNIWDKIEEALDNLTVVDPACGSGSFLVGMLTILTSLYKITYKNLQRPIDDFEIKKQIIGRSLYGVDVMEWACHIAELRLWLQLIVEADLKPEELKFKPLLPNLTFKIRPGDSLVQEIGGINLSLKGNKEISPSLKRKLTELKQEKLKFFNNDPSRKFKTEELLLNEELRIFRLILDERILDIENKIKEKTTSLYNENEQLVLFPDAEFEKKSQQEMKKIIEETREKIKEEIEELKNEKQNLAEIRQNLNKGTKPFIWDIDFVEIFSDEYEHGFDIVIGNPPYVRQEKIADPKIPKDKITEQNKKEYKEKLIKSVQHKFPHISKLNKQSDLYIYFYFHGLSLLNKTGVFCFITSNSWLDVNYGKELQEFLLNNNKIFAIYDNSAKRSFKTADVNTIIALFSATDIKKQNENHQNTAKFVMFKKPFEEVINVQNLLWIENANSVVTTDDFRVYPKKQIDLLEEGLEYPEDTSKVIARSEATKRSQSLLKDKFLTGKYIGNKWGGKYLRAPEIYFKILEKGKGKLVRLGDIAEVRRGLVTGLDTYLFISEKKVKELNLEIEFLKKVLVSPRQCKRSIIRVSHINTFAIYTNKAKKDLRGTKILKYIERCEEEGALKRATAQDNNTWYICRTQKIEFPCIVIPRAPYIRFPIFLIKDEMLINDMVIIEPYNRSHTEIVFLIIMSTMGLFLLEMNSRYNLGLGTLKFEKVDAMRYPILDMNLLSKSEKEKLINQLEVISNREIHSIFTELGFDPNKPIREQEPNPLPDRKAIDDIVFDALGLTKEERKEVYWAVAELVKNRLEKARSI